MKLALDIPSTSSYGVEMEGANTMPEIEEHAQYPEEPLMPAATTKTSTEVPEFAQKFREQLVSSLQQGQQLAIETAQAWSKAVSVLPVPEVPNIPGVGSIPGVETATQFTFDVAHDLLNAQRDFTLQLAKLFTPGKAA